jgi:hypothetical protein
MVSIANRRIDELQAALAEERHRLIAILTDQRTRSWWRRWFSLFFIVAGALAFSAG